MAIPTAILSSIIDLLPLGVVIVGGRSQIIFANAAAEETLRDGRLIYSREGILGATSATYHRALAEAIEGVRRNDSKGPGGFNMVRSGLPPVSVAVMAIIRKDSNLGTSRVVVLISDPLQKISADWDCLRTLFDLTPRETAIAQKILEGADVSDVAHELKLSTYTIRNHLKRLFSKTNAKRHSEFLYILLRSPAALRYYRDSSLDKAKQRVTQALLWEAPRAG